MNDVLLCSSWFNPVSTSWFLRPASRLLIIGINNSKNMQIREKNKNLATSSKIEGTSKWELRWNGTSNLWLEWCEVDKVWISYWLKVNSTHQSLLYSVGLPLTRSTSKCIALPSPWEHSLILSGNLLSSDWVNLTARKLYTLSCPLMVEEKLLLILHLCLSLPTCTCKWVHFCLTYRWDTYILKRRHHSFIRCGSSFVESNWISDRFGDTKTFLYSNTYASAFYVYIAYMLLHSFQSCAISLLTTFA